jgi:hypothetical protein
MYVSVCIIHAYFFIRYPGSIYTDHVLRYQDTPGVEMIVMLGEVRF